MDKTNISKVVERDCDPLGKLVRRRNAIMAYENSAVRLSLAGTIRMILCFLAVDKMSEDNLKMRDLRLLRRAMNAQNGDALKALHSKY